MLEILRSLFFIIFNRIDLICIELILNACNFTVVFNKDYWILALNLHRFKHKLEMIQVIRHELVNDVQECTAKPILLHRQHTQFLH